MKTNLLKLTIILVVIFSGCKKDEGSQQTVIPPPISYIKSINVYDTTGILRIIQTLEYDTLHRLKKLTDLELGTNPDSILLTFTFNYSEVRVFIKETISTGPNYSFTITYYLNSSGLPDSSIYVSLASPTDSTYQRYAYTYNSDDQLATRGLKNADSITGTFIYHYLNRNVDYSNAVPSHQNSKTMYFYSLEHFNTIGNENAGMGFLGKSCLNPLIRARYDGMTVDMANYTYEYDQLNRISKVVVNGNPIMPGVDFFSVPMMMQHQVMVYTYY